MCCLLFSSFTSAVAASVIVSPTTPTKTTKADPYDHNAPEERDASQNQSGNSQSGDMGIWRVQEFIIGCLLFSVGLKLRRLLIDEFSIGRKEGTNKL